VSEPKWVLREVLFDDGQPMAHREPHDWSMLEAAKESLREHMAEIHRLRNVNAELLAALKSLIDTRHKHFINNEIDGMHGWDEKALAAIAKAEGKP
jgi:hypothetical protein